MSLQQTQSETSQKSSVRYERIKLALLSLTYFLVICAYTLVKELKDSIFINVVGKEYIPWAKMISMVVLIPAVLFNSFLVDKLRRYQLLYFYSLAYGIFGFIFTYFIAHPTIGIINTDSSPYRIFGWLFYFLFEGYSPFMVSVFWAFVNSVSNPKAAKNDYGLLIAASKVGGIVSAGIAWALFSWKTASYFCVLGDVASHQILLGLASTVILIIPIIIYILMSKVPGRYLHGYEAVYQFEKEQKKKIEKKKEGRPGLLSGLKMLLDHPYVFGIFGMVFFYEVVNTVLGYLRLGIAQSMNSNISGVSCFLYKQVFFMHFFGLAISLIGTRFLLEKLGEKLCLILVPVSTGLLLLYFMIAHTPTSLILVFIALRSINYAFALPVRESLYIPTVKDMKFKSKSWIDAFGSKLAKGMGSVFNVFASMAGATLFFPIHAFFFAGLVAIWGGVAFLLGNRFEWAVRNDEVIGAPKKESD